MVYKVTQNSALLVWDGGLGDLVVNGETLESDLLSPHLVANLKSSKLHQIKIKNVSGESNVVSFKTLDETPLRMNYKDKTGELAKWLAL